MSTFNRRISWATLLAIALSAEPVAAESSLKKLIDIGAAAVVNYGVAEGIKAILGNETEAATAPQNESTAEIRSVLAANSDSVQEGVELAEATFSVLQYYEYIKGRNAQKVQATWLDPFSDKAKRARDLTDAAGTKCDVNDGNKKSYSQGSVVLDVEVVCHEARGATAYHIDFYWQKVGESWKLADMEGRRLAVSGAWYRVAASPHLNVRTKPGVSGAMVGQVEYNSQVRVLERQQQRQQISGRNGYWSKIEYKGSSGWVFDAWLERVN